MVPSLSAPTYAKWQALGLIFIPIHEEL
jgi:hypothetical protein